MLEGKVSVPAGDDDEGDRVVQRTERILAREGCCCCCVCKMCRRSWASLPYRSNMKFCFSHMPPASSIALLCFVAPPGSYVEL